jgi:HD-GYP domain-containing protein (c-di-GMP phosphodiesterase class II)
MQNYSHTSIPSPYSDDLVLETIDPVVALNFVNGIIDGRYPDLGGHQQRMRKNTVSFAKLIGLSLEESEFLAIGAGMHDIGKLHISDYIINKPSQLTTSEFLLIQQHTEIGCKLLSPLNLDSRITDIVLYHHENYDGSGYPEGLSGDDIPLLARAVRILDSYDALTMSRPYHKGVTAEEALLIMRRDSQQYDPRLLKLFGEIKLL